MHPYYRELLGYAPSDCPCSAAIYPELVSLPLYPDMTSEEVEYVCWTLKKIIGRSRVAIRGASVPATPKKQVMMSK
jgi:dTDP-4-amino-4,6-dideoxygalactose transaminase